MDLAPPQVEVDVIVRDERAEALRDAAELERQIGARARDTTRICDRVGHVSLNYLTVFGILMPPALIFEMIALTFVLTGAGTAVA